MGDVRKGMWLEVYRSATGADCTNGGISSRVTRVTVTGVLFMGRATRGWSELPAEMQVFEPKPEAPEVVLVVRTHAHGRWLHLEPAEGAPAGTVGLMMGGNFAGSSDSRWAELTGGVDLVAIHDRSETPAQYDALSR